MNRKALGVLAIAIIAVMAMVVLVGDSGLSRQTEALAKTELASYKHDRGTFDRLAGQVEKALAKEPAFFRAGAYDQTWTAMVERGKVQLASAEKAESALGVLIEADDKKQETQAREQIRLLNAARVAAVAAVEPAATEAQRLLTFKEELPRRLEAMEADHLAIVALDLDETVERIGRARADWPEKSDDLRDRLAVVTGVQASAQTRWAESEPARGSADAGSISPEQLVSLARDSEAMHRARADLVKAPSNLGALIDQLYWSWDKVLADMEIVEGAEVSFRFLYKTMSTPVQQTETGMPDADAEIDDDTIAEDSAPEITDPTAAGVKIEEQWVNVSKAEFEGMKNNLGMVVEHKPAGKYDHEAEKLIQPAGFQYVAPYGERNRYGHWRGGFWHYYGQYAFMRHMFWGRGYRMGRGDWDGYSRNRSAGRTYYGRDSNGNSRYGSGGTATKSRYSSSKYVSTGGYKNSQYVRSGGTYRGSRYASRSTGGARSGGYSRSGGRGGGK